MMDYWLLFLLGLAVGSFLNVVIYRLRFGGSALKGRSLCDWCKKPLAWYDNIPLLSYLWLKGRSRCCGKKLSIEHPLVEMLVGLQFVWVYWLLKVNFSFFGRVEGFYSFALLIYWLVLFSGSIALAVYDYKYMLIADEVLGPLVLIALLRLVFTNQWQYLLAAAGSGLFLLFLWLVTKKKGIGLGDIKVGVLMGLVLGWPQILVAYFLAFLTGASVGVILMIVRLKKVKDKIAFGPFLLIGMLLAKLWGWPIWQWYWRFLK